MIRRSFFKNILYALVIVSLLPQSQHFIDLENCCFNLDLEGSSALALASITCWHRTHSWPGVRIFIDLNSLNMKFFLRCVDCLTRASHICQTQSMPTVQAAKWLIEMTVSRADVRGVAKKCMHWIDGWKFQNAVHLGNYHNGDKDSKRSNILPDLFTYLITYRSLAS